MRVGTLGRSLSAPALMRTPSPAQVHTDREPHWSTVAREQAFARQPQRMQALQTAHALAREALIKEGASVALLVEHDRLQVPASDLPPDEFDRAELAFAEKLGATLKALARSKARDLANFEPPKYGGDIGNRIFQGFAAAVTVPAMKQFIDTLAQTTQACPFDEAREQVNAALTPLIDIGSRDRGLIAHMTGTRNAEQFGRRIPPEGYLYDPVSERPTWKNWATRTAQQIRSHFVGSKLARSRPRDLWPGRRSPWPDDAALNVFTAKDGSTRVVLNAATLQGVYESTSGHGVQYSFTLMDHAARNIACHHVSVPVEVPTESAFQGEVFELIRMRAPAPAELQRGLARLLHRMAASSLLFRGGAAFTEHLLQALASHHGYRLTYSAAWTPPDGIPPDQQALSVFDTEDFVRAGAANLILVPDTPG